jgi:hypothetical protein
MILGKRQIIIAAGLVCLTSCSVIENASRHGFYSDYYELSSGKNKAEKVYLDVSDEEINAYRVTENGLDDSAMISVSFPLVDSLYYFPMTFKRKSLDIDLTAVLLKCRLPVDDHPAQMITDFNAAIYAGWRTDNFWIRKEMDPMGKTRDEIIHRGYDFGLFAGTGATLIGPFSTNNIVTDEYNGMIIEYGLAGFLETDFASFGIAAGFDYLLSPDRNSWIYNNKPWIGLIVGIALN